MVTGVRCRAAITGQVHGDEAGPQPGQEFSLWVEVKIKRVHAWALLLHSWSQPLLQHVLGMD